MRDDWRQSASARGKAAELRFQQVVLETGWNVAMPVAEDLAWDVLIKRDPAGYWETVQVKRCYSKRGYPTVNLVRHDGSRYQPTDAEWLAAVEVETGRIWLVPFREVAQYQRKRITKDMAQFELGRSGKGEDDAPF